MNTTIKNIACAACGCICESVTVQIQDDTIIEVEGACQLCAKRLVGQTAGAFDTPPIDEAVEILIRARAPLVYGLAGSTAEAQRAAVALAEALGGTIDLALPDFHRASLQAMQSVGISTCTLGEVRQRADMVVFWGADPTRTHPRLWERFVEPESRFVTGKRLVVSIGRRPPEHRVDDFFQVDPTDNIEALAVLRALTTGRELSSPGLYSEQLRQLADRLQNAEYSVVFFGSDIGGVAEIESLFRLVRQLNAGSRCAAIALGGTQCENVLTWQTGYPYSVNFALGYPRYDPDRYSASALLEQGEVDAIVLIGAEGISELSPAARAQIADLPVIHLGYPGDHLTFDPTIQIITAYPGVHCGGTIFRMDGVPIRLRPVFDSALPTAEAILTALQQGVRSSCV